MGYGSSARTASSRPPSSSVRAIGAVAHAFGEVSEQEEVVDRAGERNASASRSGRGARRVWRAPELYVEPDLKGTPGISQRRRPQRGRRVRLGARSGPATAAGCLVSTLRGRRAAPGRPRHRAVSPARLRRAVAGPAEARRRPSLPRRDAAGLARDLSGEGIGPAIKSGILAAEAVEARLRRGVGLDGTRRRSCRSTARERWGGSADSRSASGCVGARARPGRAEQGAASASRLRAHLGSGRHVVRSRSRERTRRRSRITMTCPKRVLRALLDPLMVYTCAYYRDPTGSSSKRSGTTRAGCAESSSSRPASRCSTSVRLGQPVDLGASTMACGPTA